MQNTMKSIVSVFVIALGLTLVAACSREQPIAAAAGGGAEDGAELPVLGEAPTWTLARIDGTPLRSEELAGKVVVVDFWATWCGPCRAEIPGYVEMQNELRDQGVVIVGVSLDRGGPTLVKEFMEKYGINYPIVMGNAETVEAFGGVEAIPTTFLIDREGRVRHRKVGAMERAEYEPLVRSLL